MWGKPTTKTLRAVCVLALTTATFACGGDDDNTTSETTADGAPAEAATTAPATTAAPEGSSSSGSSSSSGGAVGPCDPFGTVVTLDLNDRCSQEPGRTPPPEELGTAFVESGGPWQVNSCVGMVAVPGQMIVTVAEAGSLAAEAEAVRAALGGTIDTDPIASDAQIITLPVGATVDDALNALPTLQGIGRSVDLNYLEPVLPNNVFRPFDDPVPADANQINRFLSPMFTTEEMDIANGKTVAVIDSTDDATVYDLDQNGFIDEDHGHGEFVRSIAARSTANVRLEPVTPNSVRVDNPSVLASGRWAPMMIEDADVIHALDVVTQDLLEGVAAPSIVNMSLGGVGCPAAETGLATGIGERLALARKMDNLRAAAIPSEIKLTFVAAAGNNGGDVLHFPAAWRNVDVTNEYEGFVDPEIYSDIKEMHLRLIDAIFAVGSVDAIDTVPSAGDTRSPYSNCGLWVNAVAYGTKQIGAYPASAPGGFVTPVNATLALDPQLDYAAWSGTSFAAANFTAALATGFFDNLTTAIHPDSGARLKPEGLPCQP